MTCHTTVDSQSMHESATVKLGCTDCHGGDVQARVPASVSPGSVEYQRVKTAAEAVTFQQLLEESAEKEKMYYI